MAKSNLKEKRKPNVAKGLSESAIAAFIAMVEIHNKPKMEYRYPTCVVLMLNAWELILKAYIYKFIDKRKLWKKNDHSITLDQSLTIIMNFNSSHFSKTEMQVLSANVQTIEKYRNEYIHYNIGVLDPLIFGLLYKSTLLFNNFIRSAFNKDITKIENMIIMPIGFTLPYNPIDFLTLKGDNDNEFYLDILLKTKELNDEGINESIFVSISTHFTSVKKVENADIIAGIGDLKSPLNITKNIRISNDPNAQAVTLNDNQLLEMFPYEYSDFVKKIKDRDPRIMLNKEFNRVMKEVKKKNNTLCHNRKLNPKKSKSSTKTFYNDDAIDYFFTLFKFE